MFKAAGNPNVIIREAVIAESPYDKTGVDLAVAIRVEDKDDSTQSDWWYGVLSSDYGIGNNAGIPRWKSTLEELERIGWKHGKDITEESLKSMIGVETTAWVAAREYSGKTYYDVKTLGGNSFGPKKVAKADTASKLKAIFGADPTPAKTVVQAENVDSVPAGAKSANPFDA
jgi:hypothetical protein